MNIGSKSNARNLDKNILHIEHDILYMCIKFKILLLCQGHYREREGEIERAGHCLLIKPIKRSLLTFIAIHNDFVLFPRNTKLI